MMDWRAFLLLATTLAMVWVNLSLLAAETVNLGVEPAPIVHSSGSVVTP